MFLWPVTGLLHQHICQFIVVSGASMTYLVYKLYLFRQLFIVIFGNEFMIYYN